MGDLTKALFPASSEWSLFVVGEPAEMALSYHTGSFLNLAPFSRSAVRLSAQRMITLNNGDAPCAHEKHFGANYSSEICYARCVSDQAVPPGQCDLFYESIGTSSSRPTQFCNAYDIPNSTYWTRKETMCVVV